MKKRIAQGKSANNLSGLYCGIGVGSKISFYERNEPNSYNYKDNYNEYILFTVAKIGLQKRIFKNGFFDISLAPIEFFLKKTDAKYYSIVNNKNEIQDFSRDFHAEISSAYVIPFFDFKIGFAF